MQIKQYSKNMKIKTFFYVPEPQKKTQNIK